MNSRPWRLKRAGLSSSFCSVIGGGSFEVGDFSGLSAGCRVITGSDDFTGPFLTNPTIPSMFKNVSISSVVIGRHVVIGSNCVIMPGVNIGDGVTVAAGAVIRKNLEPWTVYAEIKGKLMPIKKRDKEKILALEKKYLNSIPS